MNQTEWGAMTRGNQRDRDRERAANRNAGCNLSLVKIYSVFIWFMCCCYLVAGCDLGVGWSFCWQLVHGCKSLLPPSWRFTRWWLFHLAAIPESAVTALDATYFKVLLCKLPIFPSFWIMILYDFILCPSQWWHPPNVCVRKPWKPKCILRKQDCAALIRKEAAEMMGLRIATSGRFREGFVIRYVLALLSARLSQVEGFPPLSCFCRPCLVDSRRKM